MLSLRFRESVPSLAGHTLFFLLVCVWCVCVLLLSSPLLESVCSLDQDTAPAIDTRTHHTHAKVQQNKGGNFMRQGEFSLREREEGGDLVALFALQMLNVVVLY